MQLTPVASTRYPSGRPRFEIYNERDYVIVHINRDEPFVANVRANARQNESFVRDSFPGIPPHPDLVIVGLSHAYLRQLGESYQSNPIFQAIQGMMQPPQ